MSQPINPGRPDDTPGNGAKPVGRVDLAKIAAVRAVAAEVGAPARWVRADGTPAGRFADARALAWDAPTVEIADLISRADQPGGIDALRQAVRRQ